MKRLKIAEPQYDFAVIDTDGKEAIGRSFFTAELSIIKCTQGEAVVCINSREHLLKADANFLLADAMLFRIVRCSSDFRMRICRFDLRFLNEVYPMLDNKVIDIMQYSAPDLYSEQEMVLTDLTFAKLCLLSEQKDHAYRHRIAVNLVVNYILEIYELTYKHVDRNVTNTSNYVTQTIGAFCVLCIDHHTKHRNIEFYAERLNISSRYLYKIIKEAFRSTPKQVIDYYVSGTIKRLLLTTALTNQQIADQLNFPDQATLGQFFKRNVGSTLSEFRNRYR